MMYELDGNLITDCASLHDQLVRCLPLPAYYGRNLDALFDALTEMGPCVISLRGMNRMTEHLNDYAWAFLHTLTDAMHDNPALEIHLSA